jgi:hypothetical protein
MGQYKLMEISMEKVQVDTTTWIKNLLKARGKSLSWLSDRTGIEYSALIRSINLNRELKHHEVALIARALKRTPPVWDIVDKSKQNCNYLPMYGNVSSALWREKGSDMPVSIAPFGPITTDGGEQQHCYFIDSGLHKGQYAICVPPGEEGFDTDDVVVVEETARMAARRGVDLVRRTLRRVSKLGLDITLSPYDADENDKNLSWPAKNLKVEGKVIGIFTPIKRGGKL